MIYSDLLDQSIWRKDVFKSFKIINELKYGHKCISIVSSLQYCAYIIFVKKIPHKNIYMYDSSSGLCWWYNQKL